MPLKETTGKVVSDKMNKTIVVAVENRISHRKYAKTMIRTKKYKAHDENNECTIGDIVTIQETRPLSRTKCWTMVNILSKSFDN
uniref:Small ribosomal subunit protein uS17c n=2 Tax=Pyropia yezoensis TaxID=2788 RepID=RR17_PYRYE|nr:ribosomal protein S17 [Neopyropia yezoensis]Q1XDI3.1 RecName: Full=Small ribosomal subunit protein uS17c; AltName: Full=30S ribosomal protein S17, chloroplastic [Neopyropia yezoensis]ABJ91311.1 30S ribosomal protein S17 [Neopyropia yezoensis]AGH27631.1 ribosomal protein S17 [Neopyropia yezoensis]QFZ66967.1 ribosomal protein S17 [Neopyropia yezoensis]ULU28946.1 ribosomal protein S17 [Neopyropia yezoensis]WKD83462.1 ribosomal protein S17 [Neopyropia yezoensis]